MAANAKEGSARRLGIPTCSSSPEILALSTDPVTSFVPMARSGTRVRVCEVQTLGGGAIIVIGIAICSTSVFVERSMMYRS